MNQIIIATHSKLAEGYYKTLQFFNNSLHHIHYIDAYVQNNEFEKELRDVLEKILGDNVIVLTDIAGGSVNQIAAKLMNEYGFILITGINLSLVLELAFMEENLTLQTVSEYLEKAQKEMVCMNQFMQEEMNSEIEI